MAGGGPPRSNLRNGGFLDSAQHRQAERQRAERVRRERDAFRNAGLVHKSEPNYEQKVKKQFTDYAQKAHGLSPQKAEKQYREIKNESYLAGQQNVGGQSASGGGSAFNINTVSRTNAAVKPVTVRSRSGGFTGPIFAGIQHMAGGPGGAPYVANSIFDRLDKKVGKSSHLNPTYNYFTANQYGAGSVRPISSTSGVSTSPSRTTQSRAAPRPTPTRQPQPRPTSLPNPNPKRASSPRRSLRSAEELGSSPLVGKRGSGVALGKRV